MSYSEAGQLITMYYTGKPSVRKEYKIIWRIF